MNKDIYILSRTVSGSRLYHTALDNSDLDMITVFVYMPEISLQANRPLIFREGDTIFYELSKFIELLIKGELTCHEVLWAPSEYWKDYKGEFSNLRDIRNNFLSKSVLKSWLNMSSFLFEKSKELASVYLEDKNIVNFLTSITYNATMGTKTEPFQKAIDRGSLDITSIHYSTALKTEHYGLITLSKEGDLYAIWQDYKGVHGEQTVSGIMKDDALVTDDDIAADITGIMSRFAFRGMLYYDRKQHEAYKRLQKDIKDAHVIKGYAPKSLYHSFRILFALYYFLLHKKVPAEAPNLAFLMDIRRGMYTADYLNKRYQDEYNVISDALDKCSIPEDIDYASLVEPIKKLKRYIEDKNSVVPTASLV